MTSLTIDQGSEFFRRFFRMGGTMAHITALLGDDALMNWYVAQLSQHPRFRLVHGRFTPLADKLELVRGWSGVTAEQIAAAVAEFDKSERRKRYEAAVEKNELLDVVVTVYCGSVPETLVYARDRYRDAFGEDKFGQWNEAYAQGVDDNRVRLLASVPDRRDCVCIEVVDLGAHFNPKDGFVPQEVRGSDSASFAVIYAAAQNPAWVCQMDGSNVPFALVGGLELNVPGCDEWMRMPNVWFDRHDGIAELNGDHCEDRYHRRSMPVLWE